MGSDGITTIKLKESTKKRISEFGKKGETYNEIVVRLVEIMESKEQAKKDGTR